jgi:hypothetical protein
LLCLFQRQLRTLLVAASGKGAKRLAQVLVSVALIASPDSLANSILRSPLPAMLTLRS